MNRNPLNAALVLLALAGCSSSFPADEGRFGKPDRTEVDLAIGEGMEAIEFTRLAFDEDVAFDPSPSDLPGVFNFGRALVIEGSVGEAQDFDREIATDFIDDTGMIDNGLLPEQVPTDP